MRPDALNPQARQGNARGRQTSDNQMNIAPYSPAKYTGVGHNISLTISILAATAVMRLCRKRGPTQSQQQTHNRNRNTHSRPVTEPAEVTAANIRNQQAGTQRDTTACTLESRKSGIARGGQTSDYQMNIVTYSPAKYPGVGHNISLTISTLAATELVMRSGTAKDTG